MVNRIERSQAIERDRLVAVLEARRDGDLGAVRLRSRPDMSGRTLESTLLELIRGWDAMEEVHGRLDEVDVFADGLRDRVGVAAYPSVQLSARRS